MYVGSVKAFAGVCIAISRCPDAPRVRNIRTQ